MQKAASFLRKAKSSVSGYILAVLLVILALHVTWLLQPYLSFSIPFLAFIAAIMVTSWHAGYGPGRFAAGMAALLIDYYFGVPHNSFAVSHSDLAAIAVFLLEGTLIAYFIDHLQAARRDAMATQEQLKKLYLHSSRLLEEKSVTPMVEQVLAAGMDLLAAEKGVIQLYDHQADVLRLIAQVGFPADFSKRFGLLPTSFSTCGAACQSKRRIVVEDIGLDLEFAKLAPLFAQYGVVAVQSTPLFQEDGGVFGVLSTYASTPYRPPMSQLTMLDLYARQAERILESKSNEERLRQTNDNLESTVSMKSGELVANQSQLRNLLSELVLTEEHQRQQLASELHDYLAQLLVLAKMKLRQAMGSKSAGVSRRYLEETDQLLKSSVDYARTLIAELCPAELRESGLPAALRSLAAQMPQHGLAVTLDLTHESFALPHDQATLLYQSIRELLINTVKHAQVDRALVSVSVDASHTLLIVVEDHGPGFDLALLPAKAAEKHFGLASMQQRIAAIGGSVQIHSAPGKGTRITLAIPLHATLEPLSLRAANAAPSDRVIRKTAHVQDQQSLPLQ